MLSVGHDEYWSAAMRDNLEKYIADGGNVAFFSGNTCCWQVRSEDNDCLWYDRFPKDRVGAAVLGIYTQGGTVVTAGSTDWAHGLRGNHPAVLKITRNVLNRLSK